MTGTTLTSHGLDTRRKRLLFRCWHRGTREMDFLIGRFADAHLPAMSDAELDDFERLIDLPDPDLYAALTGARPLPQEFTGPMFERMRDFRPADGL